MNYKNRDHKVLWQTDKKNTHREQFKQIDNACTPIIKKEKKNITIKNVNKSMKG